jgi:hypothetical protein
MVLQTVKAAWPSGFVDLLSEDAMNLFTQFHRWIDPDSGAFVFAVVAVSTAAALVLVLAP